MNLKESFTNILKSLKNHFKRKNSDGDDMDKRDKEVQNLADKLTTQGHTCVEFAECYPRKVHWCNQTQCINSKNK